MDTSILTPTPWHRADSTQVIGACGSHVADCSKPCPGTAKEAQAYSRHTPSANAARIVQCVNACEGIEDPAEALAIVRNALSLARQQLRSGRNDDCLYNLEPSTITRGNPMRFPMNYRFIPLSERKRGTVYTVRNYLTTTNLNGTVVRTCYVVEHDLCGQTVVSEVPETTIARGEPVPSPAVV